VALIWPALFRASPRAGEAQEGFALLEVALPSRLDNQVQARATEDLDEHRHRPDECVVGGVLGCRLRVAGAIRVTPADHSVERIAAYGLASLQGWLGGLAAHYRRAMSLSADLRGSWWLESRIDVASDGSRHPDPLLGEDPVALLVYDDTGHFTAQFMRRDRSGDVETPTVAGANNTLAQNGYDAYFGTYRVDDATGEVSQELLGSLTAANVGMALTRRMGVDGDRLEITLDTTAADGAPVTRTLTWRRIRPA